MEETGNARFPGSLDPSAEEFRPYNLQIPLLPPHIYYPSPSPPPFPPSFPPLMYHSTPYIDLTGVTPPPPPAPPSPAPTRSLLLSSMPTVPEETIRGELEVFGEVRAVQMERLGEGIVTVHFYDLRHAQAALVEIQEQHMQQQNRLRLHYTLNPWENSMVPVPPHGVSGLVAGRAVWAQFAIPVSLPVSDGINQGTIVVFNLDSGISAFKLTEIFQAFGTVKEVRETPYKQHQRFVEFYDVRDADRAMQEMDGKEINGKRLLIEFSRPGGQRSRFSPSNYFPRTPNHPQPPPIQPPKSFRRSNSDVSYTSSSSSGKKSSFGRGSGNRRGRYAVDTSTLASSLACLSVNRSQRENNDSSSSSSMKNSKKGNNKGNKQQQGGKSSSNRSWKGGRNKNFDSHFLIKEDAIFESKWIKDTRTTVMIKNIPNKYSQKLILNMLDNHCISCNEQIGDGDDQPLSSYDFVYLPIDFNNKCNVGYGFVNLTSPQATLKLYKAFHLQHWEVFNSRKICEITYARLQGLEALKEHFKNSKFACETDDYLPVVFNPPRDGKNLTEPMPIGGHSSNSSSTTSEKKQLQILTNGRVDDDEDNGDDDDDGYGNDEKQVEGGEESSRHLGSSSSSATSTVASTRSTCGDETTNGCMTCTEPTGAAQGFVSCSGGQRFFKRKKEVTNVRIL